jgi:fucose permease
MSVIGARFRQNRVLLVEAGLIFTAALILALASSPVLLSLAVILLGLAMSAFYGMTLANAGELVTKSAVASGLLMSFGGLGASLLPYIAGIFAQNHGILAGIHVLVFTAALLLILTLANLLIPDRSSLLGYSSQDEDKPKVSS